MNYRILAILFLLLVASTQIIDAQEVVYTQYSSDNALISSHTTQVLQDAEDYIWISSNNGVTRFDGYNFQNFDINNQLPDNDIVQMVLDDKKEVWFFCRNGLLSYFKNDRIIPYSFNDKILELMREHDFVEPNSLQIVNDEVEFNIYEKARYKIDSQGNVRIVYHLLDQYNMVNFDKGPKSYFFNSNNKELKIIINKESYIHKMPDIDENAPVIIEEARTVLFLASQNNLYVFNKDKAESYTYENIIKSISIDENEMIWIGFEMGGVYGYKNFKLKKEPFFKELKGNSVSSLIRDKHNSLWASTTNNGVFFIPSQVFKKVSTKDGLLDNNIQRLTFSKNYLWAVYGNQSIARLNYLGVKNFEFDNKDFSTITDLFWFDQKLWVSFKNKISYFKGEELIAYFNLDHSYGNHASINNLDKGFNDDIWISKSDGFARLKNNNIIFESSAENFQSLNVNKTIALPDGTLWLACRNGLWKYQNNNLYNYNQNNALLSKNICDMVMDEVTGALWLGINGVGVVKILNDSIWEITPKNGLISNSVTSLYSYGAYIWVGTRKGLSKININGNEFNNQILNFSLQNGLIANEINDIIANKDHVYIATNKGLCYFNYIDYKPCSESPKVKILNLTINGEIRPVVSDAIEIDYNSNQINIDYKSIYFKSRGNVNYRYRIVGLNKEWTYTVNLSANYPFLPPGNYIFQVEAANENGLWSENPTELKIKVDNPFWTSWWFISIGLILIATIGYVVYEIRRTTINKREKTNKEINEYKQMALTRQMNPHFIFNSLNAIQHYILQNDIRLSNKFLAKFSKLIRLILENSQSTLISLDKELVALNLYLELESLRFKERMEYSIEVMPETDLLNINIPPMLIQPFVENAIWHGLMNKEDNEKGKLTITLDMIDNMVVCKIEDNGVGRAKANEINEKKNKTHHSLGTSITQNRIELINKIFKKNLSVQYRDPVDANGKSLGTIVSIIFSK